MYTYAHAHAHARWQSKRIKVFGEKTERKIEWMKVWMQVRQNEKRWERVRVSMYEKKNGEKDIEKT